MNWRWHLNSQLVKTAIWLLRLSGWYHGFWNYWRVLFGYAESKGLHIMPVHFYSPIPNTQDLPDVLWQHRRLPIGFDLRIDAACAWLDRLSQKYGKEYSAFPMESNGSNGYYLNNGAYRSGDAEILYAMLRDLKPRRIIEIGSGYSTLLICEAIRANRREAPDYQCEFIAIDPFPPPFLSPPPAELTRVDCIPLQQIGHHLFSSLEENDVLFIDSTHVARIGSDVVYEYLTIVPSIKPGVVVHIHDIFIPAEYPRWWIDEARFFWNEQYLLEAFLSYNPEFQVIMPVHAIWLLRADYLRDLFSSLEARQHIPSSFWIRRFPLKSRTQSGFGLGV